MSCDQVRARMPELSDGELAGAQSAALRAHIESCPGCHTLFIRFTEIDAMLTGSQDALERELTPPFGERERLAARMRSSEARQRPVRWMTARMATAALVIAATAILAVLFVVREKPAPVARYEAPFIEIPYLAHMDPNENTTIVRIDVQIATLLAAGYRVTADPNLVVPADVLVGEDGRARAIRVLADIDVNGAETGL